MDTIKAILTRRSIRAFKEKKIPRKLLEKIIKCAKFAPSSKDAQPWKFYVIQNKKIIIKIGEILINSKNKDKEPCDPKTGKKVFAFTSSVKMSGEIIKRSPCLIIIENACPFSWNRKEVMKSKFRDRAIGGHDSEFLSIGAAMQNICLSAHAIGLATTIMADVIVEEKEIKKLLGIKGDLVVGIPIGYPTYKPGPKKVKKNLVKYLK